MCDTRWQALAWRPAQHQVQQAQTVRTALCYMPAARAWYSIVDLAVPCLCAVCMPLSFHHLWQHMWACTRHTKCCFQRTMAVPITAAARATASSPCGWAMACSAMGATRMGHASSHPGEGVRHKMGSQCSLALRCEYSLHEMDSGQDSRLLFLVMGANGAMPRVTWVVHRRLHGFAVLSACVSHLCCLHVCALVLVPWPGVICGNKTTLHLRCTVSCSHRNGKHCT